MTIKISARAFRYLPLGLTLFPFVLVTAAADMADIGSGLSERVEAHDVCRIIQNETEFDMMVPLQLPEEWHAENLSFLQNIPQGIIVSLCPEDESGTEDDPEDDSGETAGSSDPPPQQIVGSGAITATSNNHPVFQLFQDCFNIGTGLFFNVDNGSCTRDDAFWDTFEAAACSANPYLMSITMNPFLLATDGDACQTAGFDAFAASIRVSECKPTLCVINNGDESSCQFSCD